MKINILHYRLDSNNTLSPLSPRETQILLRIACGLSPKKMAEELRINEKTISTYRARIFQKLNLRSNAEIALYAYFHGLISVSFPPESQSEETMNATAGADADVTATAVAAC